MTEKDKLAYRFLLKDKHLRKIVAKIGPMELKKRPKSKYFESLVRAIVGQQLSTKAASTIYTRFTTLLGKKINPTDILAIQDEKFREVGISRAKTLYIKDLASRVNDSSLEIDRLNLLSNEKVLEELVAVKGIGKWTAQMFMMFSLARPDIFPIDDLGIKRGLEKLLNKEIKISEMEEFGEKWSPYRTYASLYIWENLDN